MASAQCYKPVETYHQSGHQAHGTQHQAHHEAHKTHHLGHHEAQIYSQTQGYYSDGGQSKVHNTHYQTQSHGHNPTKTQRPCTSQNQAQGQGHSRGLGLIPGHGHGLTHSHRHGHGTDQTTGQVHRHGSNSGLACHGKSTRSSGHKKGLLQKVKDGLSRDDNSCSSSDSESDYEDYEEYEDEWYKGRKRC